MVYVFELVTIKKLIIIFLFLICYVMNLLSIADFLNLVFYPILSISDKKRFLEDYESYFLKDKKDYFYDDIFLEDDYDDSVDESDYESYFLKKKYVSEFNFNEEKRKLYYNHKKELLNFYYCTDSDLQWKKEIFYFTYDFLIEGLFENIKYFILPRYVLSQSYDDIKKRIISLNFFICLSLLEIDENEDIVKFFTDSLKMRIVSFVTPYLLNIDNFSSYEKLNLSFDKNNLYYDISLNFASDLLFFLFDSNVISKCLKTEIKLIKFFLNELIFKKVNIFVLKKWSKGFISYTPYKLKTTFNNKFLFLSSNVSDHLLNSLVVFDCAFSNNVFFIKSLLSSNLVFELVYQILFNRNLIKIKVLFKNLKSYKNYKIILLILLFMDSSNKSFFNLVNTIIDSFKNLNDVNEDSVSIVHSISNSLVEFYESGNSQYDENSLQKVKIFVIEGIQQRMILDNKNFFSAYIDLDSTLITFNILSSALNYFLSIILKSAELNALNMDLIDYEIKFNIFQDVNIVYDSLGSLFFVSSITDNKNFFLNQKVRYMYLFIELENLKIIRSRLFTYYCDYSSFRIFFRNQRKKLKKNA